MEVPVDVERARESTGGSTPYRSPYQPTAAQQAASRRPSLRQPTHTRDNSAPAPSRRTGRPAREYKRDKEGQFSAVDTRGGGRSTPTRTTRPRRTGGGGASGGITTGGGARTKGRTPPPLEFGARNDPDRVRFLQRLLKSLKIANLKEDGVFGEQTERAVMALQRKLGMTETGRVSNGLLKRIRDAEILSPCANGAKRSKEMDMLDELIRSVGYEPEDEEEEDDEEYPVEIAERRQMSSADINDLPDSAFAYIEPGGTKDNEGKTTPRSKRHFPIHDEAHVRNALARMSQSPHGGHAKKKIMAAARKMGIGDHADRSQEPQIAEILRYDRSWALDDIVIRSGGDGRTVEAYAAVFDTPSEIKDQHGHYMEVISRSAFNRAISHGIDRINVLYNHGMTVHGTSDALGSVPIGSPVDIRPDGRGLRTVTRFNRSQLADSVLEAIRAGDIRGYSFRGRIFQSNPSRVPRGRPGNPLPTITRTELGLAEYGPTPTPAYADAGIVAVRSLEVLAGTLAALDAAQRTELVRMITVATPHDPATDTATPDVGPGTEDSPPRHSGRIQRFREELRRRGVL